MHDKAVRRRRAVLALLVAVSLISLTAYFGESPSSPLHAVQRGIVQVLSPVQEGASRALGPVRDVAGWFSSTFHAKSQASRLQAEVRRLTEEYAAARAAQIQNQQFANLLHLDDSIGVNAYHPVPAHVIQRDPILWYETIEVDKGTADGVVQGNPVIGDRGLVGDVTMAGPNFSVVTLITAPSMAEAAKILDGAGDSGVLVPDVGNPQDLVLQYLPRSAATIQVGQQVVTAGFKYGSLQDLYPPNIPIGTVSEVSATDLLSNGEVHVTPMVDLRHLDAVQVLTTPHGGRERAQVGGG